MSVSDLCPRDKHDFERLNALVAAGPQAAEPLLGELLEWLRDINWPIAPPLADFLVSVGEPLLPHIRQILTSGDDMWIYWVLQYVVARLPPPLTGQLAPQLYGLATAAENDMVALRLIVDAEVEDRAHIRHLVDRKLDAYEELVAELRTLRAQLKTDALC